jgi:hypothetical protein
MSALQEAFYIGVVLSAIAAVASLMRGKHVLFQTTPLVERVQSEMPRPPILVASDGPDPPDEEVKDSG